MSRRDQIVMTAEEVTDFLEAHRTVHVASIGREGRPHLTTLWYGMVDGKIAAWTYGKSQKIRNLERDPRITALVESGNAYTELKGVQIQGTATLLREQDDVMRVAEAVYAKNADRFGDVQYQGGILDRESRAVLEAMSAKRVAIVVEPDDVVSWDHTKLGGTY